MLYSLEHSLAPVGPYGKLGFQLPQAQQGMAQCVQGYKCMRCMIITQAHNEGNQHTMHLFLWALQRVRGAQTLADGHSTSSCFTCLSCPSAEMVCCTIQTRCLPLAAFFHSLCATGPTGAWKDVHTRTQEQTVINMLIPALN